MTDAEHDFTAEPREAQVDGVGLRLNYLDWGPAPGSPVVFLHGGGLNAHTWDVVCDVLHTKFHCLAIDLRGHGDSDWAPDGDYSLPAYVADLSTALDQLGLERPTLVGMSLGGVVALTYAGLNADRLRALVLVDTGPGGSRPGGRRRLGAFMDGPAEFASVDEIVERALEFNPRRSPERLRRTLLRNLRQTPRGTWAWKYDPQIRGLGSGHRPSDEEVDRRIAQRSEQLWRSASAVTCPTLIVRGGESDMFLDDDAERAAAAFRQGRWIRIDGASHTVQSDAPHALAGVLQAFLLG